MHEVTIAQALLTEVAAAASQHGLRTVSAVGVAVGRLSGVAPEALMQAFEVLRDGRAGAASLDLRDVEGADLRLEWIEGE